MTLTLVHLAQAIEDGESIEFRFCAATHQWSTDEDGELKYFTLEKIMEWLNKDRIRIKP